jgi:hypothetical protein
VVCIMSSVDLYRRPAPASRKAVRLAGRSAAVNRH